MPSIRRSSKGPSPPRRFQAAIARRSWSASPGVKPGGDDGQLHHLLLEERHAERPLQHAAHLRRWGTSTASSPFRRRRYGMHHVALDRAGPDDRHLDHQVVEQRGRSRGSMAIWARDSIWNTPIVSARQIMS